MKKAIVILSLALFAGSFAINTFAHEGCQKEKTECTKEKKACDKEKKACDKDKKACDKKVEEKK